MDRPPAEYLYLNLADGRVVYSDFSLGEVIPFIYHSIWLSYMCIQYRHRDDPRERSVCSSVHEDGVGASQMDTI